MRKVQIKSGKTESLNFPAEDFLRKSLFSVPAHGPEKGGGGKHKSERISEKNIAQRKSGNSMKGDFPYHKKVSVFIPDSCCCGFRDFMFIVKNVGECFL